MVALVGREGILMKTTLLVLSSTAQSPKAIDIALERSKKCGDKLIVLYVVDTELPTSIFERLEGTALIGEAPGHNVQQALLEEYARQGKLQVDAVMKRAKELGIKAEAIIKTGIFAEECIGIIRERKVECVVITRQRNSHLSRFIFGSPIKKIQDNVTSHFEIVDLD